MKRFFVHNWQRKFVAVLAAIVIWFFVNHSINETKTIPQVPIRLINLPPGMTAIGMSSNGTLGKRITLTLSGTKDVIDKLERGDIEVQVDASEIQFNEWVLHLTKKNLVSLNPAINLSSHITHLSHNEYIIRLSKLITDKIPIFIKVIGETPPGYEFLDVWPEQLMQTVTGPEKEIQDLKRDGIETVLNLDDISKEELDKVQKSQKPPHNDEISYFVPDKWKFVTIPFYRNNQVKALNDPDVDNIRIDFLREELLELERDIPIRVFYPIKYSETINPHNFPLAVNSKVQEKDHIAYLKQPFYVSKVSQLFLDLVRENIEIAVIAAPREERQSLQWSVQIMDPNKIEETYVAYWLANLTKEKNENIPSSKKNEALLRERFRDYMQKLTLHSAPNKPLCLQCHLEDQSVVVEAEK